MLDFQKPEKRELKLSQEELDKKQFFVYYSAQEIMRLIKVKETKKSFDIDYELDFYVDCEYVGDERGLYKDTFTIPMIIADLHKSNDLKTFDECVKELKQWDEDYSNFLKSSSK